MKKFIFSACFIAVAAITNVYAEQPTPAMDTYMVLLKERCEELKADKQIPAEDLVLFKDALQIAGPQAESLLKGYPELYQQLEQFNRCKYYLNIFKTFCQKHGKDIAKDCAHFIPEIGVELIGLAYIKMLIYNFEDFLFYASYLHPEYRSLTPATRMIFTQNRARLSNNNRMGGIIVMASILVPMTIYSVINFCKYMHKKYRKTSSSCSE
jgi:hypothetical protein